MQLGRLNYAFIFTITLLSACTSHSQALKDGPPQRQVNIANISDAVPKAEPRSRYGNPPSYEVFGKRYQVMNNGNGYKARGIASWYGSKFHHQRTSSGEPYDMFAMTAAHKTLPLPSYVRVTNLSNGRHIVVKVNDRGPFHDNRLIDLSYVAAKKLGITAHGTGYVEIAVLDPQKTTPKPATQKPAKQPQIYLQIGAFSQRYNAEKLANTIRHLTQEKVVLQQSDKGISPIYRVQIGPLVGVGRSTQLHDKLKSAGVGEAIAVAY